MTVLTGVPSDLFDGPTLARARPAIHRVGPEGAYGSLTAIAPPRLALISGTPSEQSSIALVLPLDELFEDRVTAARRAWRTLVGGKPSKSAGFTTQRQRRLKLTLRALDAALLGIGYREIAQGLFGDRVPNDASWRTHSLRASTIRLVREGHALMHGGYLRLLRPEHRKR